jgi:hypothetical protein
MKHIPIASFVLIFVLLLSPGCRSVSPQVSDGEVSEGRIMIPELPASDVASLALPRVGVRDYVFTAGANQGLSAQTYTEASPYDDFDYQTHTADNRIEYLAFSASGEPQLYMTEDLHHGAATFYTPPIPVIPHNLEVGETRTYETHLTVLGLRNPSFVRDSGPATVTITNEGAVEGGGTRVTTWWSIDLTLADVVVTSKADYHPELGLTRVEHDETITALFIPIKSKFVLELAPGLDLD